jgi:hypothetical protein
MSDEAERLLKSLVPTAALDRDEVMFRAGQASGRNWFWPAVAAVSTTTSIVLAVLLYLTPAHPPTPPAPPLIQAPEPTPFTPEPPPMPVFQAPARRLEEAIMRDGLKALGPPEPVPPAPKQLEITGDI